MKRLILIFALLILLPVSLDAGRGFTGTDIIVAGSAGTALDISTGPMTVSAWFYPTTVDSSPHDIVTHGGTSGTGAQFQISLGRSVCGTGSGNNITFNVGGGSGCLLGIYGTCGTITTGRWYFVLLFVDSSGKYYGSPTAGVVLSGYSCGFWAFRDYRISGGSLNVGGYQGTGTFKGWIAEVGIWNDILNPSEIAALKAGVSPNRIRRSSLAGYFPLYGAHSPEPDYSGNKDNGTLTGTTTVPHCPCGFQVVP
jgi:hypothetical protein